MAFTAPDSDLLESPKSAGFIAPDSDLVKGGFTAPQADLVDLSKVKGSPVNQQSQFSSGLPAGTPPDQNPDWGFTQEVAKNPIGFLKTLPQAAGVPFEMIGKPLVAAASDAGATIGTALAGRPDLAGQQGGNLWEFLNRTSPEQQEQPTPQQQVLSDISAQNPVTATVGKIAQGTVEMAPMMAAGLPEGVVGKLIGAGFTADMIANAGDAATRLGTEMGKPPGQRNKDAITSAISDIAQSAAFAPGMAAHVAGAPVGERFFPNREAVDRLAQQLKSEPDFSSIQPQAAAVPVAQGTSPATPPAKGFVAPEADIVAPTTPPVAEDQSPIQQAVQPQPTETAPSPTVAPVLTPDGKVDPVQTAIAQLRAEGSAPMTKADLADLLDLQNSMRGNQLKPSEPTPAQPSQDDNSQPEPGTTVSPAPVASEGLPMHPSEAIPEDLQLGRIQRLETKVQAALMAKGVENPGDAMSDLTEGRDLTPDQYEAGLTKMLGMLEGDKLQAAHKPLTPALETATTESAAPGTDTVTMYHGGIDPRGEFNGPRDITPYYEYAKGYADKSGSPVWEVQVPENAPYMRKGFEEFEGGPKSPWINTTAPADVMRTAKLAEKPDDKQSPPLATTPETATTKSAAPGTDTVRTAGVASGNASQRGQSPASSSLARETGTGVTAEGGVNPPLGEGDTFKLKGATQEVDGQTSLRMDKGSLEKADAAKPSFVPEETKPATASQKAEQLAQKLEGLKSGIKPGGTQFHAFGVAADLWDRAITLAQNAIRAGGTVADAINAAFDHIKENFKGKFDEEGARAHLEKALTSPGRPLPEVQGELSKALDDLKSATSDLTKTDKGTQGQRKQAAAVAAARYRTLLDEQSTHPDFVAQQILRQHNAITEANKLLKPARMSVSPEDFPNPNVVEQKLGPAVGKRVNQLSDEIAGAQSELARTNRLAPKMVDRITNEMMRDGRLPKMAEIAPNAGRTLQAMTDALNKMESDSPKLTFAERFNVAKKVADAYTSGKDFVTKAWGNSVAASKALASIFDTKAQLVTGDFKDALKSWIGYDTRTAVENSKYAKAIVSQVPNKVRRQAISAWLDADGDESILKFQRDSLPEKYHSVWDAALKLTPGEKKIAMQAKSDFAHKLADGQLTGIIGKGREDYGVPQMWKKDQRPQIEKAPDGSEPQRGTAGNPYAKLDHRDPFFSFQRETPSYFDGIMAKGEPVDLDIAHLVSHYDEAFHKALSSRGFIRSLKDALTRIGEPIAKFSGTMTVKPGEDSGVFVDSQTIPKDAVTKDGRPYVYVDHWALKNYKFAGKDPVSGTPVFVRGNMLVHPDYAEFLKNELNVPRWTTDQAQGVEKIGRFALQASSFLKASKFIGPFHVMTEALHAMTHGAAGTLEDLRHGDFANAWATKGAWSPSVHGFEIDLNDPKQALLSRNMMIDMGRAREMYDDGIRSQGGGIWGKVPGLGDAVVRMNNFTFNEYIPRLKMKVGLAVLERNMARYGKELSQDQIAELTGRQMDAAFGGQNWRLMGANKNVLAFTRLAFVAPDFLISRAKVVGQALKPYNAEQRYFLMAQAVGVYALSRVLNSIFSDDHDPHWEARNWDKVVIGKRAYGARFIVSDAANFARDMLGLGNPTQNGLPFISGRLGVIPKTGIEALSGRDLFTGQKAQGMWDSNPGVSRMFSIAARDVANWMTPMAVDGFMGGARKGQTGLGQVAAATLGVSSHKESPMGQVWDMARNFNLNSKDPKAVNFQKQRDNDAGKPSDYSGLDNLLDAGDMKGAQAEYNSLKSDGKTAAQIAARYDRSLPFTGNQIRESQFLASLSPDQKALYQKARAEQQERRTAFNHLAK